MRYMRQKDPVIGMNPIPYTQTYEMLPKRRAIERKLHLRPWTLGPESKRSRTYIAREWFLAEMVCDDEQIYQGRGRKLSGSHVSVGITWDILRDDDGADLAHDHDDRTPYDTRRRPTRSRGPIRRSYMMPHL